MKTFDGYKKRALTDEYALLAGGGHKPLSDFSTSGHTHSQYVDLISAQTISGVKTFSSQIKSSVATGISPFSITSTTLVNNLNADLLDGYHANGLFTTFSGGGLSSSGNTLSQSDHSITIGGVTKTAGSSSVPIINSLSVSKLTSTPSTNLTTAIIVNGINSIDKILDFLWASALTNTPVSDPAKAVNDTNKQALQWFSTISNNSGYAGTTAGFPTNNNANGILYLGLHSGNGYYAGQLGISSNGRLYYRYNDGGTWSTAANGKSWKTIAWITDNVASATKLQTSRTLWGQPFDGTANVNGCLNITSDTVGDYTQGIRINQISTTPMSSIWLATTTPKGYNNGMWGISATNTGNFRIRGGATSATDLLNITQSGNVGIGITSPSYKLHINGTLGVAKSAIITGGLGKNNIYVYKPDGADYRANKDIQTGAICISLPADIGNTMVSMWIDVYNYVTNKSFSVHVGGYTYNNQTFVNSFAMVYGASHKVRLTYDNGFKIYIGETTSTWGYPQISVRDVLISYSSKYISWLSGWSISFVTTLPKINKEISRYVLSSDNYQTLVSPNTHTHSILINGITKTIAATGGTAVDLGNYKTPQTAVSDPTSSGNSISFIDTISQNTNGVITATKKTVPTMRGATTSIAGTAGLVPAPAANQHTLFLKGDGTWATPSDTHWTTHLYIGTKDTANSAATTNDNTYIKITDNSTIRNQYIIKGTGRTTVASDADGNITITSPTVTWSEISDKPSTFAPSTHNHPTSQINALTNYTKATAAAALTTNDSLNAALGKLEYKLDIAYDLVTKANDSDGTIENLKEILDVLAGIKDTETIKAIIGKYLPLTGGIMTGVIKSTFSSGSWINGVTNAIIKGEYTGYGAILSMPVKDGRVSLSSFPGSNNNIYFGYATTAQISANTNSFNKQMYWDATNNNLHADVFTGSLSGNASSATKLTTSAGSAALPIYFSDGKPIACTSSSIFSNLSNSGNNLSITVAGQNRILTVNYANSADKSNYLTSIYVGNNGDTVEQVKQKILDSYTSLKNKQGYSIQVNSQFMDKYPQNDYIIPGSGIYSLTYLTPGYDGKSYGQWLAACLGSMHLYVFGRSSNQWTERKTIAWTTDIPTSLKNPNTLTLQAGTFAAKTYDGSTAVTVNIPTHTSHLINNSGFLTQHQSLANYVTLNTVQTITDYKIFRMNVPADDRETVYYNIGLKLSSYGDNHKKVAAIGLGNEPSNWYKAAIGFERTNTYDRGDIVFLLNNSGDRTTCTYSDIKIRIKASGNINTLGSISANGFIKTDSSDSYILLGGGGHKAISDFMLKTDELSNNLTTISKSLTVTKDWMDTGIKNTDLSANGTYIIQVSANNTADSIRHNYWSGIMSWYKDGTDDSDSDEIILHRAGHAYGHTIYLRTIMTTSSDGRHLRLQIAADTNLSTAVTYTFKFKRVI